MPYPKSFEVSPFRYGAFAQDALSELPEPAQTTIRQILRQEIPTGVDPMVWAANFDGMGWMAEALNYRLAGAELHRVAESIRRRFVGVSHG